MPPNRLNVLIFAGPGSTTESVRHATWSLRHLLGPNYAVIPITSDQLIKEPWLATCALLVMPGGADLGYCRVLNGAGNRRIRQYVQGGGAYLGLCAGGYYGCARCEFEVGRKGMEVVGERELAFFPGVCRGLVFAGFVYNSEAGARAVGVRVEKGAFGGEGPEKFMSYYNGGGLFVDAKNLADRGVEVLATFEDDVAVDAGQGPPAAVVFCKVGEGRVILTGPHPEFAPANLSRTHPSNPNYPALVDALLASDPHRTAFLQACLTKLGLHVPQQSTPVPSLSPLHLSAAHPQDVAELVHGWHEAGIVTKSAEGREEMISGENDTFVLLQQEDEGAFGVRDVVEAVAGVLPRGVKDAVAAVLPPSSSSSATAAAAASKKENRKPQANSSSPPNRTPDSNPGAAPIRLIAHESSPPTTQTTPAFSHPAFFSALASYTRTPSEQQPNIFGTPLLYGSVVTSTNTLLEKNLTLLSHLPVGTTATATTQIAGRGRGTNVWVSPPGSLMFSTVLRHGIALGGRAPVVFVQYLAAMAVVEGVHRYERGYEKLPVRLKWPNDIYALDPSKAKPPPTTSSNSSSSSGEGTAGWRDSYTKIGGILVNSSYSGGDYTLVVGIGLNTNNAAPSVSLSQLAAAATPALPPFSLEVLLASILVRFQELYTRFCRTGWDAQFQGMYSGMWLHEGQVVTLEAEGGVRARIRGISSDWGLLVAEEVVGGEGDGGPGKVRTSGKRWELQSDSNSFDFFRGLVRRKV